VPESSFSSISVGPDFPSMLFSYLFTTSSPLPLLFLRMYSVVWHILLLVPVVGGEFSAHSCKSCCIPCLEVTRGLGENGRNFQCNVGATQPIQIFLPPPSRKSTQLYIFNILPSFHNSTKLCGFGIFNSFCHGPCNGSDHFPPSSPPFLPPPSVFPIIVWTGDLPARHVQRSTYRLVLYSPPYPPPIPMIVSPSVSTYRNPSIVFIYISGVLLPPHQIPPIPPLVRY